MPRIPTYTAQVGLPEVNLPALAPGAAAAPWYQLAESGREVMAASQHALAILTAAKREQEAADARAAEQDAALDVQERIQTLVQQFGQAKRSLQDQGADPDGITPAMQQWTQEGIASASQSLKYPDTARVFRYKAMQALGPKLLATQDEARKAKDALNEVRTGVLLDQLREQATKGTPEDRIAAVNRAMDLFQQGLYRKWYTPEQFTEKLRTWQRQVTEGTIDLESQDPAKADQWVRLLKGGHVPALGPVDVQVKKAEAIETRINTEETRREARLKQEWEDEAERAISDFKARHLPSSAAYDKTLTMAQRFDDLESLRRTRRITGAQYDAGYAILTAKPEKLEQPSDPTVLFDVTRRMNRTYPQIGQAELERLHNAFLNGQPGLNFNDYRKESDKLVGREQHAREYGHTLAGQKQSQAEQKLYLGLGVPPYAQSIDTAVKPALELGLTILTARSNYFDGKEDPDAVVNEILPSLQATVGNQVRMNAAATQKFIDPKYPTPEVLEREAAAHRVPKSTLIIQRKVWENLRALDERQQALERRRQEEAQKSGRSRTGEGRLQ